MKNHLFRILVLLAVFLCLSGCYMTQNPLADITKQGTVIKPGQSITIESEIGPVAIEYVALTKRRVVWSEESREFSLLKAAEHAGVFAETKFRQGPIKDVYGVNYGESTLTFLSDKECQEYLQTYVDSYGFEHRPKAQMVVRVEVAKVPFFKQRWLYIGVHKYQITDGKKDP